MIENNHINKFNYLNLYQDNNQEKLLDNHNHLDRFAKTFDTLNENILFFKSTAVENSSNFLADFVELMNEVEEKHGTDLLKEQRKLMVDALLTRVENEALKENSTDLFEFITLMSIDPDAFEDVITDLFASIFKRYGKQDLQHANKMATMLLEYILMNENLKGDLCGSKLIFQFLDRNRESQNEVIFEDDNLFKFIKNSVFPLKSLRDEARISWTIRERISIDKEIDDIINENSDRESAVMNIFTLMKKTPNFFSIVEAKYYGEFFSHLGEIIKNCNNRNDEKGKKCKELIEENLKSIADDRISQDLTVPLMKNELEKFAKYLRKYTDQLESVIDYILLK